MFRSYFQINNSWFTSYCLPVTVDNISMPTASARMAKIAILLPLRWVVTANAKKVIDIHIAMWLLTLKDNWYSLEHCVKVCNERFTLDGWCCGQFLKSVDGHLMTGAVTLMNLEVSRNGFMNHSRQHILHMQYATEIRNPEWECKISLQIEDVNGLEHAE